MKRKVIYLVFVVMTAIPRTVFSQGLITGPTCVLTGITYQYDLKPKWDGSTEMVLCVSGGAIEDSASDCITTASLPFIRIIWNQGIDKGSISYSYGDVKDSVTVFVTTPLVPGSPEADKKVQKLSGDTVPQQIDCSLPTGGNCLPDYKYQWQQSSDGENWEDLSESKNQHLAFQSRPSKTTFYRRKTTESKSGSIAYTEVSMVVIQPEDIKGWNQ